MIQYGAIFKGQKYVRIKMESFMTMANFVWNKDILGSQSPFQKPISQEEFRTT